MWFRDNAKESFRNTGNIILESYDTGTILKQNKKWKYGLVQTTETQWKALLLKITVIRAISWHRHEKFIETGKSYSNFSLLIFIWSSNHKNRKFWIAVKNSSSKKTKPWQLQNASILCLVDPVDLVESVSTFHLVNRCTRLDFDIQCSRQLISRDPVDRKSALIG